MVAMDHIVSVPTSTVTVRFQTLVPRVDEMVNVTFCVIRSE